MRRRFALILSTVLTSTALAGTATPAFGAQATDAGDCNTSRVWGNCDSLPDQTSLEAPGTDPNHIGNWADLTGGVANRPYVKSLSLTNGDTTVDLITDATGPTDPEQQLSTTAGSVGVVIEPYNLCDTGYSGDTCYSTPNRVAVSLVYRKGVGQVGSNFDAPNTLSESSAPGTITPIKLKSTDGLTDVTINSSTVLDLTLGLNTLGQTLHWTWLNGIPSFWQTASLGQQAATIRVKFTLAQMPVVDWSAAPPGANFCTALPVAECNLTQSGNEWRQGNLVLSLDNTGGDGGIGALFATERAIIGSVETGTDSATGLPTLSFGMSGPHFLADGSTLREGSLHAVIPAVSLVHDMSMPSLADTSTVSAATTPRDLISVARTGSAATGWTSTLSEWTATANGTDAVLLEVTGVTFSVPKYSVKPKSGTPKSPKVRKTSTKVKFTVSQSKSGAVAKACKADGCTIAVYRVSSSPTSTTLVKVASKNLRKGKRLTIPFTISRSKAGTARHLIVLIKNKRTGVAIASIPVRW